MNLHPYKNYCCSADCYKVFQIVRGYNVGVYNKDEFKSKLKNVNLNDLENYQNHIKTLIKDALKEDRFVAETVEQIEAAVEVNEVVSETADNVVSEEETIVKEVEAIMPRKRNKMNKIEETE